MTTKFNFKVQKELKGIDIRIVTEDETILEKIAEDGYLGLTPFGYEKEWFFIEFDKISTVDIDNHEELVQVLQKRISLYNIDVIYSDEVIVSEVPKMEVYYAINNDGPIEDETSEVTMSVSTKYDYEVNETFEIATHNRLLAYTHNIFDVCECFESHLEIYNLKFLEDIPKENAYFIFIHNNDLQTYSDDGEDEEI